MSTRTSTRTDTRTSSLKFADGTMFCFWTTIPPTSAQQLDCTVNSAPKGKHPESTNRQTWKIPGAGAIALLGDYMHHGHAAEHSKPPVYNRLTLEPIQRMSCCLCLLTIYVQLGHLTPPLLNDLFISRIN
ncbi:hypothetical protein CROQUDRAFT_96417 [Cronartium quercuum f. sp. fusiforme G11]|uniref:Uncharacterized protein n=1 Tax=Cronartium quercuum f. sp. fusiforme G11 TaxID=708437 RepID=A0A9P6NB33_9BASI|nr:hypothetical protein CROQUDRAFT_96417 [Cronartium quercuum f. sp. fusiforme G11]